MSEIVFELAPNGHPVAENAERYRSQVAAETAAERMLREQPDVQFVELHRIELERGVQVSMRAVAGRVERKPAR